MWQIIGRLIGALIALAGVIMIYDARLITKKYFSFGDKNEATTGLKMLGTIGWSFSYVYTIIVIKMFNYE